MNIYATSAEDRLAEVQGIYDRARLHTDAQKIRFDNYDRQYRGDGEIDGYIEGEDGEGSVPERARVSWNLSYKLLEGSIDVTIPQPLITPEKKDEHHLRNARRAENLIKMILDKKPWEIYNDEQERTVKKYGCSGYNVEWSNDITTHSTVGEVEITPLRPHHIYPQPGIKTIDDCDYVFVDYVTTRSALLRRYSLTEDELEHTEYSATYEEGADSSVRPTNEDDVVTVTVMWYVNDSGDVCRFAYSGSIVLEDDDDYYSRRVEYCATCNRRRQLCERDECDDPHYEIRELEYDELEEDIRCSDGRIIPAYTPEFKDGEMVFETVKMPVTDADGAQMMRNVGGIELPAFMEIQVPKMKKTRLPYYKPRKIPIAMRYNIRDDKSFWGISLMEMLKNPQQEANKLISRIEEAVMRHGAGLIIPDGITIEPSNGVFKEIYRLKEGMSKEQFGEFQYGVDISPWVAMLDKFLSLGTDLSGVTDTYLGQADSTARSGFAKSLQLNQSLERLASVKVNKQAHYAEVFRSIFELYLAFADEKRAVYHSDDGYKRADQETFNRYDFYEFDPFTGEYYVDDCYTFAVDPNGSWEQQYIQLWDIVKADYASGMYGDPAQIDTKILAWQHLERLRYPFAREVVDTLKEMRDMMMQQMAQSTQPGAAVPVGAPSAQSPTVQSPTALSPSGNMIGG